jgi:hypothetical protein
MTFFVIPGLTRNPENSLFSMDSRFRGNDNEAKSLILQKSKNLIYKEAQGVLQNREQIRKYNGS